MLNIIFLVGAWLPAVPAPAPACWIDPAHAAMEGRPSPLDSASVAFAGDAIKVCYGRPSMRGRTMLGGTDPFGRPWRLGANEATTLFVPVDVIVGDLAVPAGRYSLYTVPDSASAVLFVNRTDERWGVPINAGVRANDLGSTTAAVERTDVPVETLTMRLVPGDMGTVTLIVEWEQWRVRVPIRRATD